MTDNEPQRWETYAWGKPDGWEIGSEGTHPWLWIHHVACGSSTYVEKGILSMRDVLYFIEWHDCRLTWAPLAPRNPEASFSPSNGELPPVDVRKKIRRKGRLSQAQLGELVGCSGQMVGRWERGFPASEENAKKYAAVLLELARGQQ